MTGQELLNKLENAINLDAEVFINTTYGEFRIMDVITHYQNEITIECVNPYTNKDCEK
jgi:hypothetical protein